MTVTGTMLATLLVLINKKNNQVRTAMKITGEAHLSPNPNLAMDKDSLDSHTPQDLAPM